MTISVLLAFLFGFIISFLLSLFTFFIIKRYDENRYKKDSAIIKLHKEIEVRRQLNIKIIEILNRPVSVLDKNFVDPREDVKVAFADYNYLKNFTSLHNLYMPVYFMDQFFKNLSNHLAIFEDQDDLKNGGYIFRDSRRIFEDFSIVITSEMESKKKELKSLKNIYPEILRKQNFDL
ncbi:hypothetical protein [Lactovum miscens]|uniref:Uncharacterized protein n=1 Tax=Lactovum miscens TaxID=190387 RepID=A0A841C948_9LACT|nr:hypothetical protein [Lactovum miscens]MBB5888112.1 hypothetical protein [Lactovum miscens]